MKKRFIGPANPGRHPETGERHADLGHEINVGGHYLGSVKSGDVLEIPDELCEATDDAPAPVWPESLWEDVSDAPKAAKKKSEGEGS